MGGFILMGLILGLGAAIPFGPINVEMTRRNLAYGTAFGLALGLGACAADVTYLLLLTLGVLGLLDHPLLLRIVGVLGAGVLLWFAYLSFKANVNSAKATSKPVSPSLFFNALGGYLMTLLNPYTILFWASVSAQLPAIADAGHQGIIAAGIGVILGTMGWNVFLNITLHYTRHRLPSSTMKWLNYSGALILTVFALFGLWQGIM